MSTLANACLCGRACLFVVATAAAALAGCMSAVAQAQVTGPRARPSVEPVLPATGCGGAVPGHPDCDCFTTMSSTAWFDFFTLSSD